MYQHLLANQPQDDSPRPVLDRFDRLLGQLSTLTLFLIFAGFVGSSWYFESSAAAEYEASCEKLTAFEGRAKARINALAMSEDGKQVAAGQGNGHVVVWFRDSANPAIRLRNQGTIRTLAFAPNSPLLAAGGGDRASRCGELSIWDVQRQTLVALPAIQSEMIHAVAWSPDGRYLAAVGDDARAIVWRSDDWQRVAEIRLDCDWAAALAFCPHDGTLVIGCGDGTVRRHEVLSGRCLQSWQAHRNSIRSLTFSPEGSQLATMSDESMARIWTPTGQLSREICGIAGLCRSVLFANDGRELVVSAGFHGTPTPLRRWRLDDGVELPALQDPSLPIPYLAVDGRGLVLASGGGDTQVRVWSLLDSRPIEDLSLQAALPHSTPP